MLLTKLQLVKKIIKMISTFPFNSQLAFESNCLYGHAQCRHLAASFVFVVDAVVFVAIFVLFYIVFFYIFHIEENERGNSKNSGIFGESFPWLSISMMMWNRGTLKIDP